MIEIWELKSETGKPDSETQTSTSRELPGLELRIPTRTKRVIIKRKKESYKRKKLSIINGTSFLNIKPKISLLYGFEGFKINDDGTCLSLGQLTVRVIKRTITQDVFHQ